MQGWLGVVEEYWCSSHYALLCPWRYSVLAAGWLARLGGTFECSLRLRTGSRAGGWSLGIGRYNQEILEWFRFFSFAFGRGSRSSAAMCG